MLLARRLTAAATAGSLIAGGFFVLLFSKGEAFAQAATGAQVAAGSQAASSAQQASGACKDAPELTVLPSPLAPWKGAPLRVMIVTEKPLDGALSLIAPDGSVAAKSNGRQGGPPYAWIAEVASPAAGTWRATLAINGGSANCTNEITVAAKKPAGVPTTQDSFWKVRGSWNTTTETLFSAWIEKLFDAPPDQDLSWKAWHEVLHDKSRNFLFNYLGRGEDDAKSGLKPDCADFAYFLRAYFAYKMGLPFGYSNCSRGAGGKPPKCYQWFDIEHPELTRPPAPPEQQDIMASQGASQVPGAAPASPARTQRRPNILGLFAGAEPSELPLPEVATPAEPKPQPKRPSNFNEYLRAVGDVVHSGTTRVAGKDDNTDFYTVALTEQSLRPGTVYADPYGHVLMLVHRVPEVDGKPGVFLAVDAEPDGSITRKRFWRGNFLFAHDPGLGSAGFKHFRPIVREKGGALRRLANAEIAKHPSYGDFSLDQANMSMEDFYDRMDDVMSPEPLDPVKAMTDAIASLHEQVKTRVTSVENGRKYQEKKPGEISMPNGPSIFQTSGPWEDYSTPARDFRLLIAIDVVRGFPRSRGAARRALHHAERQER